MSTLDALLALPQRWPAWKRISAAPDEIEALRNRVELLEMSMRQPAGKRDQCPKCNGLSFGVAGNRKDDDFGDMGISYDRWTCSSCGYSREIEVR